ncbi:hypothetical protein [Roseateles sp. P5_E4]
MRKIVAAALAFIGLGSTAQAVQPTATVDAKTVRFTMPTVAADEIQFVMPTRETFEGAPQFHEDDWRQVEFLPSSRLSEIKTRLTEYKSFEAKHRTKHGWTDIYARRLPRMPVLGSSGLADIASSVSATNLPAPILTTTSRPLGQVKDGYALRISASVFLYGLADADGVTSLAALVDGDDRPLTKAFITLNKKFQLVLVDWRSQMVLVSTTPTGQVNVWRP